MDSDFILYVLIAVHKIIDWRHMSPWKRLKLSSSHKESAMRKVFACYDVIMYQSWSMYILRVNNSTWNENMITLMHCHLAWAPTRFMAKSSPKDDLSHFIDVLMMVNKKF